MEDGLAQASSKWRQVADEAGRVNSNYGYYIFHQTIAGRTQYEWALHHLLNRPATRRALINVNQPCHRRQLDTRDFPCAIAAQLFERDGKLCAEVSYRSVDVVMGLPYDMGFFAFVTELVWRDLLERSGGSIELGLGYTMLKTSFTQIYDQTAHLADTVLCAAKERGRRRELMPSIESTRAVLRDIRCGTAESPVVRWLQERAKTNEITVGE